MRSIFLPTVVVIFLTGITEKSLSQANPDPGVVSFSKTGDLEIHAAEGSSNRDFDFLIGKWKLKHRKIKALFSKSNEWEEFETVVEDFSILEGTGNMDIGKAIRNGKPWEGRTLRLFDRQTKLWSLYWMTSAKGVLDPPVVGSFDKGIGRFYGKDKLDGKDIIVLFLWDKTDPERSTWSQAFSNDNGKTWEWNWFNVKQRIKD